MNGLAALAALLLWLATAPAPALAAPPDPAAFNGFDVSAATVPLAAIERGGPPRDGIPAIDQPQFVAADKAPLRDGDRVLALSRHGTARAYPVRILNWHEVVNDRIGPDPVVITYCPLCGTGMAFAARAGEHATTFGVSGLLYNSDVLLYDRATGSLWSQVKQESIAGPLRGTRLQALPLEHTTWADWRARHPHTQVLSTATGHVRDYDRDPYAGYERIERLLFSVEHRDDRFPLKEWVLGLDVDGARKAYPFGVLARATRGSGSVRDTVGGRTVRIEYDGTNRTARAFDGDGRLLPGVMAYWFAWVAFHPGTEVFRAP